MIKFIKGTDTIWDKTTIVLHENEMLKVLGDGLKIELTIEDEDINHA